MYVCQLALPPSVNSNPPPPTPLSRFRRGPAHRSPLLSFAGVLHVRAPVPPAFIFCFPSCASLRATLSFLTYSWRAATWKQVPPIAGYSFPGRAGACLTSFSNRVWLLGGYSVVDGTTTTLHDVWLSADPTSGMHGGGGGDDTAVAVSPLKCSRALVFMNSLFSPAPIPPPSPFRRMVLD
jgi:hypothetical protein